MLRTTTGIDVVTIDVGSPPFIAGWAVVVAVVVFVA